MNVAEGGSSEARDAFVSRSRIGVVSSHEQYRLANPRGHLIWAQAVSGFESVSIFIKGTTCSEHPTVLMVRLDWLAGALRGDGVWADTHADRRSQTFKPERYETVLRQVQTDAPIHMPWLYFDKGRTTIMDGRHRLYVLIDLGYTHVPVLVDPDHVASIATLVDPDFVGKFG